MIHHSYQTYVGKSRRFMQKKKEKYRCLTSQSYDSFQLHNHVHAPLKYL